MEQSIGLHRKSVIRSLLVVPHQLWLHVLETLRQRSAGQRESAGILIGTASPNGTRIAIDAVFHHHLADDRATALSLELPEHAKFKLYADLVKRRLSPVSLIHTHPEAWVDLSAVDQSNRISSTVGFWSIVVPYYGSPPWNLDGIGFHVLEDAGWKRLTIEERHAHFRLEEQPWHGGKTVSVMA
jgi:proteasome lid subunit RPN8/RPN11